MTVQEYIQLKAFARIDGAIMGGLWIVSFACFVMSFHYPMLGTCSLFVSIGSVIYNIMRIKGFRDNVREGVISFRRCLLYSMLTFLYASIILVLAQLIYFKFLDHGALIGEYMSLLNADGVRDTIMKLYGLTDKELNEAIALLRAMKPTDIALQLFMMNLFGGFIVSLFTALIIRRK